MKKFSIQVIIGANLSYNQVSLRYCRFLIGCAFAEYDLFKPTYIFIQNFNQLLRHLGFSLYPFSFILYSPFKLKIELNLKIVKFFCFKFSLSCHVTKRLLNSWYSGKQICKFFCLRDLHQGASRPSFVISLAFLSYF